ncbi:excisionase family DNA-binding protein [Paraburkholderia pallida]|nr:excisionase family DNA-binding protein [Paraburkholderia pallida]
MVIKEDNDVFISIAAAAELLFVSRQHVAKLIEEGTLPLHHVTGQNRLLRKADVLEYKAKIETEAKAFFETQTEDKNPPGLCSFNRGASTSRT